MKNSMTWRLLIALILICIPVALRSSAMANEDKEYPITVDGGHAEDLNGNVITSAKPGTSFQVVPDDGNGRYWTKWESEEQIKENTYIFWHIMPNHEVRFTAQTVSKRKDIIIDLTVPQVSFTGEEAALLKNALIAYAGTTAAFGTYDFDGDGTSDVSIENRKGETVWVTRESNVRASYDEGIALKYSLGTAYTIHIPHGEAGTIRLVVNNAKSEYPVLDRTSKPYSITVDYERSSRTDEAIPGEFVTVTSLPMYPQHYLKEILVTGIPNLAPSVSYTGYSRKDEISFLMPPRNVSITFITAVQEPLYVYFDEKFQWKPDDLGEIEEAIKQASGCLSSVRGGIYGFDFDDDFVVDIEINLKTGAVIAHRTPYTEETRRRYFEKTVSSGRTMYWPVTIVFPDYEIIPVTQAPTEAASTVTPSQSEALTATPFEEAVSTPTPYVNENKNKENSNHSVIKGVLIACGVLLFCALFVWLIVRLKKGGSRNQAGSYGNWNEDRVTIDSSSGTMRQKKINPDALDIEPEDDGDNDNPGSIV